jgi:hypothetical protein
VAPVTRARALAVATCSALGLALVGACSDGGAAPEEPAGPPGLRVVAGAGVTDTIEAEPAQALLVGLRDADGKPVAGEIVRFQGVPNADGSPRNLDVSPVAARSFAFLAVDTTDARGQAAAMVRLGARAGAGAVAVTVPALGIQTTAAYTVRPGAPAGVAVQPEDSVVYVGGGFALASVVRDRHGNVREGAVTYDFAPGAPVVAGTGATVTGAQIGRGRVVARLGALADTAWVSVVPRGVIAAYEPPSDRGTPPRQPGRIVQLELDGSDPRVLVERDSAGVPFNFFIGTHPRWAPGGEALSFVHAGRLWMADARGAARPISTTALEVASGFAPEFSGDGQWLYYTRGVNGTEIWRLRIDGSGLERTPAEWPQAAAPSPAPTGGRFVYQTSVVTNDPIDHTIRIVDIGTGARFPLDVPGSAPRWSPTGESIAYLDRAGRLRVMRPDGTDRRVLGDGIGAQPNFVWSPDGRWLLVTSAQPTATDPFRVGLSLVSVATGEVLPLRFTRTLLEPSWRR